MSLVTAQMMPGPQVGAGPLGFSASVSGFVLERDVQAHPVVGDLPVLHRDVEPRRLGDAEVANRAGRGLDGTSCCSLPRVRARSDHFGDAIDAVAHASLLRV